MLKGENFRLFSVCRSSKDIAKWLGFKQISWGETLIPKEQFKDVEDKYQLEVIVRDVKPNAKFSYVKTRIQRRDSVTDQLFHLINHTVILST